MFMMPDNERLEKEIEANKKLKEQKDKQKSIQTLRDTVKRKKFEKQMTFERRMLHGAFIIGLIATLLFLISFCTDYWVTVSLKEPQEKTDYERNQGRYNKTGHHHGLWRFCRYETWPGQEPSTYCRIMTFEVLPHTPPARIPVETKMADFRRSTVAVGLIALVLGTMAHAFTWYSIQKIRYMFKRVAGSLHLITGASCWVVSEVFRQAMMFEKRSMKSHVKEFSEIKLGWSYYLVWASLAGFLIPGCMLLYYSRKRKREYALSLEEAEANEPVVLGRI